MNEDINQRLVAAVKAADSDATLRALSNGADPNTSTGRFRGSVLDEAAAAGSTEIVQLLIDSGANIGPGDGLRATPLAVAVMGSHIEVVRILLARGALELKKTGRASVLTEAINAARFHPTPTTLATLHVLMDSGATPLPTEEAALVTAVMGRAAPAVLRILLAHGADADQRRSDRVPVLVLAARRGDDAAIDVLVNAGAKVDAVDPSGRTALMHAVERDHQRCAAVLLLAGADPASTTSDGTSAVELARGWQWQNIQFMLGERSVGRDVVPIARTTVRLTPSGVRLAGDKPQLGMFAEVIDIALADLGDDEWEIRTGLAPEAARQFSDRLRNDVVLSTVGSWHQIDTSMDEFAVLRAALLELAYGTTRSTPTGGTRLEVIDMFEELKRQVER